MKSIQNWILSLKNIHGVLIGCQHWANNMPGNEDMETMKESLNFASHVSVL